MEKIWLKNYHDNVATEIDVNQFQSLAEVIKHSCETYPNKKAFTNLGTSITFKQLDEYCNQIAAYFQYELNLKKGDRVAIMMPNLLQYPIVMFAALRAGLTVVNVNPLYTAPELIHILNDSGAETIIILENFANVLEKALPQTKVKNIVITQIGDFFPKLKSLIVNFVVKRIKKMVPAWNISGAKKFHEMLAEGKKHTFKPIEVKQDDIAFLQYTGGTTGVAKGTILSHKNIIANLLQLAAWVEPVFHGDDEEKIITALPLYHIFSLTVNCFAYALLGAENILITNPRDIKHFIHEIKDTKFTAISGVNTLFNAMLHHPDFNKIDFSRLHTTIAGGMALQENVAKMWHERVGSPIIEGYGLTEASPVVTANPLDLKEFNHSIGLALPSTDVAILDDDGNEVPMGEKGELCVKGPQVMVGYWNSPEQTKKAFTESGWLRTGDIAKMDEKGFVYIVDRKKDMVIVSGFNVYPNEVEDVITKHPGVLEAAVVGVPDEESGEIVKAFIVKKDNAVTEDEIIEFCRQSLTRYKIPKQIEFREELPKTNVGKILRRALRE